MIQLQFQTFDGPYLQQLRSGDCRTEEHFVAYFNRFLQLKLYKRLRSRPAMEDVCQETFARVWIALRKEEGIRRPERLGAFVNSVCNNVLREYYRSASKLAPSEDDADNIPDPAVGAIDRLANRQLQGTVDRILAELPRKERDLLRDVFLEERDKNEVCRKFGVDREYLRVLLHRAKRHFKSVYVETVGGSQRLFPHHKASSSCVTTSSGSEARRRVQR